MKPIRTIGRAITNALKLPTIKQGHTDDLIYEDPNNRLWRSRMTVEDGMPYKDQLTWETYHHAKGCWTVHTTINPNA